MHKVYGGEKQTLILTQITSSSADFHVQCSYFSIIEKAL